ncbi:MAG: proton-conducting transporter membrane subunit [bacterium]
MITNYMIFILVLPLIGVAILRALGKNFSDRNGGIVTTAVSGAILAFAFLIYPYIHSAQVAKYQIDIGLEIPFSLYLDALGYFVMVTIAFVWLMASWYSIEYMKKEHDQSRFHTFSLFSLFGMLGMVTTGNLVSLFIFFEIMSVLSYFLVIHEESQRAMQAGAKYLFMGVIGGLVLLGAIIMTYLQTGSVDLSGKGLVILQTSPYFVWIFWAYIFGFAVKAGMFPVHVWLPEAHPIAPTPASVLLSAVMIKAGAYGIIRTIYAVYGSTLVMDHQFNTVIMVVAVVTMIMGSVAALVQTELKRLLAYSSIAQIGYVILGATLLSREGLIGSVLHIFNHAMMKGALFMCAGAIAYQTGIKNISDMKGISRKMPLTMLIFTIAACSMIGFPPFVGFLSKWFLAIGALSSAQGRVISSGGSLVIIGSLILSSILNAIYYGPVIIDGWFGKVQGGEPASGHVHQNPQAGARKIIDPNWTMLLPMLVLTLGIIFFAIFPELPLGLARLVATSYIK